MYNHRSHLIKKCMSYARQHCSQSTFPLDIRNCMEVILSVCVLICPTPHVDFFNLGYLKVVSVNLRARSGGMRLEKQEVGKRDGEGGVEGRERRQAYYTGQRQLQPITFHENKDDRCLLLKIYLTAQVGR